MKASLILGTYNRPELLELNFWSLTQQTIINDLEIIVCNDYIADRTEEICYQYRDKLSIKYIFTGQRHVGGLKWRSAGYALNIGVKQASGDIIILSCPEVIHLNNTIELIIKPLLNNPYIMSIGEAIYFDDTGNTVEYIKKNRVLELPNSLLKEIQRDPECKQAVKMPYLMGIYKKEYIDIGGYDEDFKGWAAEDSDFVGRLESKGLKYYKTKAEAVHLYHGKRCDGKPHPENPLWVKNWELYQARKGWIIRNENREWGTIQ